jgi:predicted adenylyl cyclase CyaB
MREVELKSVVTDVPVVRKKLEEAGGVLTFEGRLVDLRYGDAAGQLLAMDHVLRLRTYEHDGIREGHLDWKGPTEYAGGYKVREELSTSIGDPETLERILANLGYTVIRAIERDIAQYALEDAMVRFEKYPRMDELVEVEGSPEAIERAIAALGLARSGFTTERLPDFVARYEARTGTRAALTDAETGGKAG